MLSPLSSSRPRRMINPIEDKAVPITPYISSIIHQKAVKTAIIRKTLKTFTESANPNKRPTITKNFVS